MPLERPTAVYNDVLQSVMGVDPQPPVKEKADLQKLTVCRSREVRRARSTATDGCITGGAAINIHNPTLTAQHCPAEHAERKAQ